MPTKSIYKAIAVSLLSIATNAVYAQVTELRLTRAIDINSSQVQLEWNVEDPFNPELVIIEQSKDDKEHFLPLDTVQLFSESYLVQDVSAINTHYYRLTNLTGSVVSPVVAPHPLPSLSYHYKPDSITSPVPFANVIGDDLYYGMSWQAGTETPFYKYNFTTKEWHNARTFEKNVKRSRTFVIDNELFLVYSDEDGVLKDFAKYDPVNDEWTMLTFFDDLKSRQTSLSTTHNGIGYYGFGSNLYQSYYYDLWEFNPQTNNWNELADFSSEFTDEIISFMYAAGNSLYLVSNKNYIHEFNLESKVFTYKYDSLPDFGPRYYSYYAEVNDELYLHFTKNGSSTDEEIWKYNQFEKQWLKTFENYNLYWDIGFGAGSKLYMLSSSKYVYVYDAAGSNETKIALDLVTNNNDFTLKWKPVASIGTSYTIEFSTNHGNTYQSADTVPISVDSYTFAGVVENQTYFFRVQSILDGTPISSNVVHGNIGPNWKKEKALPSFFDYYGNALTPFYIGEDKYFFQDDPFSTINPRLWKYEAEKQKWSRGADFPGPKRAQPVAFATGGKGYILSGHPAYADSILTDVWKYDPGNDTWTQKNNFPGSERRTGIGFGTSKNGYVGLGYSTAFEGLRDLWKYNPETDSWLRLADFPGTAFESPSSMPLNDTLLYVGFGNDVRSSAVRSDVWSYNLKNNAWSQVIPLTTVNEGRKGVTFQGKLFAFEQRKGGYIMRYDTLKDSWIYLSKFPGDGVPREAFSSGNKIYAMQESGEMWSFSMQPFAVSQLSAEVVKVATVKLKWNNSQNAEGDSIIVERKNSADEDYSTLATLNYSITQLTDTLLIPGLTYQYRLKSFNLFGESSYVSTSADVPAIDDAPAQLTATYSDEKTISLAWSNNATEYESIFIERSLDPADNFDVIDILEGNATTYVDLNLPQNQLIFNYRVRAFALSGFTDYSNTATIERVVTDVDPESLNNELVWPNPADNILHVKLSSERQGVASITSLLGSSLLNQYELGQETTLDISNLKPGLYILKITSGKTTNIHKLQKK